MLSYLLIQKHLYIAAIVTDSGDIVFYSESQNKYLIKIGITESPSFRLNAIIQSGTTGAYKSLTGTLEKKHRLQFLCLSKPVCVPHAIEKLILRIYKKHRKNGYYINGASEWILVSKYQLFALQLFLRLIAPILSIVVKIIVALALINLLITSINFF